MLEADARDQSGKDEAGTKVARNAMFLLAGQFATMVMSVFLTAALGRALGVVEFGNYFLLQGIATFAYVIVEWGQSAYLVRESARRENDRGELLGGALVFRVVVGFVVALVAAAMVWFISFNDTIESLTLLAVACGLPLILAQAYAYVFRSLDRMDLDAAVGISGKSITVLATLVLLSLGGGLPAVILMQAVGGGIALVMAARLARKIGVRARLPRTETLRGFAVDGAPIAIFFVILNLQQPLDAIILSRLASPEEVGWYGAARTIMTLLFVPAQILGVAIFPEMSRVAASTTDLNRILRDARRMLLFVGALGSAGTFLFADIAVSVIYGQGGFQPSILLLQVFSPVLLMLFMDILFGTTLTAIDKTREVAVVKAVSIIASVPMAFLLIPFFHAHYGNGAIGLLVSFGVTEALMLTMFLWLLPKGALDQGLFVDFLRAIVTGGATVVGVLALPVMPPWLAVPSSIALFTVLAFATGLVSRADVRSLAALRPAGR